MCHGCLQPDIGEAEIDPGGPWACPGFERGQQRHRHHCETGLPVLRRQESSLLPLRWPTRPRLPAKGGGGILSKSYSWNSTFSSVPHQEQNGWWDLHNCTANVTKSASEASSPNAETTKTRTGHTHPACTSWSSQLKVPKGRRDVESQCCRKCVRPVYRTRKATAPVLTLCQYSAETWRWRLATEEHVFYQICQIRHVYRKLPVSVNIGLLSTRRGGTTGEHIINEVH